MANAYEVNFDGIVGPTHNYSGLSEGNLASMKHRSFVSNPREAALQGLKKMKALLDLGLKQGVLPPQERPHLPTLRRLGFTGTDPEMIEKAGKLAPEILRACSSASSMWTANSATMAPSCDTEDGKVHFTPANLTSKFHRSIESATTAAIFRAIFSDPKLFVHHDPLPASEFFGDEGAANHTRLAASYEKPGLHLFVYGKKANQSRTAKFAPRQSLEASQSVARLHGLSPHHTVFAEQSADAIDAGVFHNDVIGVGNENLYFFHEKSFSNSDKVEAELTWRYEALSHSPLTLLKVRQSEVSLEDAVRSYLFNSQLIRAQDGKTILIAPEECQRVEPVKSYLDTLLGRENGPLSRVIYFDLRQSMSNGGGPACLRFRAVLSETELKKVHQKVLLTDSLYQTLTQWVMRYYRDKLEPSDLFDPKLYLESCEALDALTKILGLPPLYAFQKQTIS